MTDNLMKQNLIYNLLLLIITLKESAFIKINIPFKPSVYLCIFKMQESKVKKNKLKVFLNMNS